MSEFMSIDFAPLGQGRAVGSAASAETLVVFVGGDLKPAAATVDALGAAGSLIEAAAAVANFKGKAKSALDLLAPTGLAYGRLLVVGLESKTAAAGNDVLALGGAARELDRVEHVARLVDERAGEFDAVGD